MHVVAAVMHLPDLPGPALNQRKRLQRMINILAPALSTSISDLTGQQLTACFIACGRMQSAIFPRNVITTLASRLVQDGGKALWGLTTAELAGVAAALSQVDREHPLQDRERSMASESALNKSRRAEIQRNAPGQAALPGLAMAASHAASMLTCTEQALPLQSDARQSDSSSTPQPSVLLGRSMAAALQQYNSPTFDSGMNMPALQVVSDMSAHNRSNETAAAAAAAGGMAGLTGATAIAFQDPLEELWSLLWAVSKGQLDNFSVPDLSSFCWAYASQHRADTVMLDAVVW